MNLLEAVKCFDDEFDEHGFGKVIIYSKSREMHLINSKHCICKCGYDWPTSYTPTKEDFLVEDWVID